MKNFKLFQDFFRVSEKLREKQRDRFKKKHNKTG